MGEFQAGPVDVTTYLGVNVRLSGEAEAGAQLSMVAPFDVSAALSKRGGRHRADSAERPRFQPEIGLPDAANALAFRVSVELELTVTFMMSIDGVPIGGPVLQASLGAVLDVDPGDAPWWTINGLAGLGYGWSMPDVDDGKPLPPDRIYELFTQRPWLIADADGDPPPLADASTRWSRSFDIHEDDEAGAVIADGDGLVVLERDGTPWMATLSGLGNPTWQEQSTPLMTVEGAARTAAGDLVTAGASGLGGVRVERFDAARRSEWAEQIDIDNLQSGTWSAVVPTGEGVIVAGNVRHTDGTDAAALVAVDGQGDVRWATEIDPGPLHTDVNVRAAERAPNGDLLIVGQAFYFPDAAHDRWHAFVMRVRPDGTVSGFTIDSSTLATGIAVQPDGSYAISGQTATTGNEHDHESWVAEFAPDDTLLWSSTYLDRPAGELASVHGMATGITPVAGGYVVSGVTGDDSWLIRLDRTGMPLWSKTFVGAAGDTLTGVVAMPDGVAAYGQTATTDPAHHADIWVVRTNIDGMVHFDPDSGFDTINGAVQWSSGPAHTVAPLDLTPTAATWTIAPGLTGTTAVTATNYTLA